MSVAIGLYDVQKSFGNVQVVCNANLEIGAREMVVLVGPSGCGKSTLLRLIAGLEEADSGKIFIGGKDMTATPAAERGLSMVFQSYALYPHKTAGENMGFALKVAGRPQREIDEQVARAARILDLEGLLQRKPRELSGGQRQRVAIGRSIVRDPLAFLFDEPLSNLDAALRAQTRVQIARLRQRLSAAMLYVTHDQVEAMTLADRIVVLSKGRVEQTGKPLELYNNPANLFVASFLGSPQMNILPCAPATGSGVRLAGGAVVETSRRRDVPGTATHCGVRPEHIALVDSGSPNAIAGAVVFVERLGADTFLHIDLAGGGTVAVRAEASCPLHAGDAARLQIQPAHLHLFAESGRALTSTNH